jgi:hypothetical protein
MIEIDQHGKYGNVEKQNNWKVKKKKTSRALKMFSYLMAGGMKRMLKTSDARR